MRTTLPKICFCRISSIDVVTVIPLLFGESESERERERTVKKLQIF